MPVQGEDDRNGHKMYTSTRPSSTDDAIRVLKSCCLDDLLVSFPCSLVGDLRVVVNRVDMVRLPRHDILQVLEGFVHLYHAAVDLEQRQNTTHKSTDVSIQAARACRKRWQMPMTER